MPASIKRMERSGGEKTGQFRQQYGPAALIAGASEGLGAAYSHALAARGLDLVLVARRPGPLDQTALDISNKYGVQIRKVVCDLADPQAHLVICQAVGDWKIGFLVYNAAYSHIGSFLSADPDEYIRMSAVNVTAPMALLHHFGARMLDRGRGGVVLMSSIAGMQGAGFLAAYGATKAFARILAEGLWYEWGARGVDIIACCAGATATPNYVNSKPLQANPLAPKPQSPEAVAEECLRRIGRNPSFVSGRANRLVCFLMQNILPRRMAIRMLGNTMRAMYNLE